MKVNPTFAATLAGSCLTWSPGSLAQAPGDLSIEVSECVELTSDLERYACYERLTEAALSERASGEADTSDVPVPPLDSSKATTEHKTERPAEEAESADIFSTIAALDEVRPNVYTVTLENGQIWRQAGSQRYPLRVGFEVRIYPSRWGGLYRLSAIDRNGFIQVERIR